MMPLRKIVHGLHHRLARLLRQTDRHQIKQKLITIHQAKSRLSRLIQKLLAAKMSLFRAVLIQSHAPLPLARSKGNGSQELRREFC